MRKYIFIKDEAYSSNLYTNFTEYLNKDNDLKCKLGGSEKYKIKLMLTEEADNLVGKHPMMLTSIKIKTKHARGISLVSFGGCILDIPIDLMMYLSQIGGSCSLCSFSSESNEASVLAKAEVYTHNQLKKKEGTGYLYLSMINLEGTDVFYLILNPTLVHAVGHIELEGDPWIQQIKGIKDTIKDSIFNLKITPELMANHVFSGGLCIIDMLGDSIIQTEDREEFFHQLKIETNHREEDCEVITSFNGIDGGHHMSLVHLKTTPWVIKIKNKLLGDFINKKEELKWEFVIVKES